MDPPNSRAFKGGVPDRSSNGKSNHAHTSYLGNDRYTSLSSLKRCRTLPLDPSGKEGSHVL